MATDREVGEWIRELKGFTTLGELHVSDFFKRYGTAIQCYLNTPQFTPFPGTSAHLKQFCRAVSWNIEKGIHLHEIAEVLRVDPHLRVADLIFINEADVGMARSGNLHVARELAHILKMNYVFAPAYLELTKGMGSDREASGDNHTGVQGNAILSRYPLGEALIVELPPCHDGFLSEEKRYGRRVALKATVYTDLGSFWAVCTHLEVLETPECRTRQMRAILDCLASAGQTKPTLIAGDWNTHTFSRGTRWRALRSYSRIGFSGPGRLKGTLLQPDRSGEGVFGELRRFGFSWREFNDREETHSVALPGTAELTWIPGYLQWLARRRLRQHDQRLRFRLDWFAAQGMQALHNNEERDIAAGVVSCGPVTRADINRRFEPLSDHHPIAVDIKLPPEEGSRARSRAA